MGSAAEHSTPVEVGEGAQLSDRQRAVLDAALSVLVEDGVRLTMTGVARRASCSKETLYKWFGDRDGLLTATVQWQASRVRGIPVTGEDLDRDSFRAALEQFAADWLGVISGSTSVALNRYAVGQAGSGTGDLGAIVLRNGPAAMRRRLMPVLKAGEAAGIVSLDDRETAFSTFFGLVVRDIQIRLLLGDSMNLTPEAVHDQAARAAEQFLLIFGSSQKNRSFSDR